MPIDWDVRGWDWATLVDTKEASLETGSEVEDGRRVKTAEEFDAAGVPKVEVVEDGELDEVNKAESKRVEVIGGAELLGKCVESSAREEETGTVRVEVIGGAELLGKCVESSAREEETGTVRVEVIGGAC